MKKILWLLTFLLFLFNVCVAFAGNIALEKALEMIAMVGKKQMAITNKRPDTPLNGIERLSYNKRQKKWLEIPYINGKIYGYVKEYYKSGKIKIETPFINNKKNGIEKEYYRSGKVRFETSFHNGERNGIEKEYEESGELLTETPYVDGIEHGLSKSYDSVGRLRSEGIYKNGNYSGYRIYYESGKLQQTITMEDFKVVSGAYFTEDGVKKKMTNAEIHNRNLEYNKK